jgi:hypothetical protein
MAQQFFEREPAFDDRFKASRLFIKGGKAHFGIWRQLDVVMDGDEEEIIVQEGMEGQLDTFAQAAYQNRALWPVIASTNLIDFPMEQVTVGRRIRIPKPARVAAALQAATARGAQIQLGAGSEGV